MAADTHHLIKSILIPQVVSRLMETYSITENDAIRIVYTSPTGKCLDDDSLGLYGQSALYICGLIEKDIQRNPELLMLEERKKIFRNEEYESLIGSLVGDIFYTGMISNTTKIAVIRRYSEIVIRKIFNIPETERMTLGGKKVKEEVRKKDCPLLTKAIENLRKYGDDNTHTEKTSLPTDDEFKDVVDSLYDLLAYLFIDYFKKYPFGSNNEVVSSFSILPPLLRFKVLNELYEKDKKNICIIDRLVLAILKSKSKDAAVDWIENRKCELQSLQNSTKEADDGLAIQYGKNVAEQILAELKKDMYQSCLEKINAVSEQISKNGALYKTFEEAKKFYEENGILPEESEENKEFNSIMEFCYLGRRIEKKDYPDIGNYVVGKLMGVVKK